ncbi:hypothetical protein PanWU01x14_166180 [Parasponia andersonii]|uniref:Uncharacterized protein n=1 Tax=Parasponia andersonii TaxID=3476 RepID=A0A2P5CBG5_PARAD|nr:hypothetical protein PanWU01x14_166180 [Parasponia andersonii]
MTLGPVSGPHFWALILAGPTPPPHHQKYRGPWNENLRSTFSPHSTTRIIRSSTFVFVYYSSKNGEIPSKVMTQRGVFGGVKGPPLGDWKLFLLMGYGGFQRILLLMETRLAFGAASSCMGLLGFEWFSDFFDSKI